MRGARKIARTEQLKELIARELKKVCTNIAYEQATDKMPYPYLVYSLSYTKSEDKYNYQLEVNVWDKNKSTKTVEEISDNLESALDGTYFSEDIQTLWLDINTRNTVEDSNKELKRRRLLFDLQYYTKRG